MLKKIMGSLRKYAFMAALAGATFTGCDTPGAGNKFKPSQDNYSIVFEDVASELSLYDNNVTIDPNDCDNGNKRSFYPDQDGDGYGLKAGAVFGCSTPEGYVSAEKALDCNDNNALIHPGVAEICNNLDDNCNGKTDEAPNGEKLRLNFYDGPIGTSGVGECKPGVRTCLDGTWQITAEPSKPLAEICDSLDNDCDGQTDIKFQDVPLDLYLAIEDSDSIRANDPGKLRFLASEAMINSAGDNILYGNPAIFAFAGWGYDNFVADKDLLAARINYLKDSYSSSLGENADLDFALRMGIETLIDNSDPTHKRAILLVANGHNVHPEQDGQTTAAAREAASENGIQIYGINLNFNDQGSEAYFQEATDGYLRVDHNGIQDDGKVYDSFEEMGSRLSVTEYRCDAEGEFVTVPLFDSNQ